jgi:hypothetical protein
MDGDPMFEQRKAIKAYYLGGFDPEHYVDAFLEAARKIIESPKQCESSAV